LNRDVWRNDLVENLVWEGFILWQTVSFRVYFCKRERGPTSSVLVQIVQARTSMWGRDESEKGEY
jgi:hypothetical protein